MKNIIVIGAGASGLMAAVTAARSGCNVTLIDSNSKIGRKICATGNGRCNYSNVKMSSDFFRTKEDKAHLIDKTLERFGTDRLTTFFSELGMLPRDINGYLYPASEQASSVTEMFSYELKRLKVKVILDERIVDIRKNNNGFLCIGSQSTYLCDALIISVGGLAAPNMGSDGNLYPVIKRLGHTFTEMYPALTGLLFKDKNLTKISGVRFKAGVGLYADNQLLREESGELIINKEYIGGIPVMQLSTYYGKNKGSRIFLKIDLFDEFTKEELYGILSRRFFSPYAGGKTIYETLTGLINAKLLNYIIREAGLNPEKKASVLRPSDLNKLILCMKELQIEIVGTCGFDKAQVTSGGIPLSEVNSNFQSYKLKGLYLTGEILDVDGMCGGYNLQWAFSSGYIAGENAAL